MLVRQWVLVGLTLPCAVLGSAMAQPRTDEGLSLTEIRGLAYSADGERLLVGGPDGLTVFTGGAWAKGQGPAHRHRGFSATRDALYSSGHPEPESGFPDPIGLIKSTDGGKTWHSLGLGGESDFHNLATSWGTNAVFASNRQRNSRMDRTGIHYTLNDGADWHHVEGHGLGGPHHRLAVHPSDPRLVAAGTDHGLFLSRDRGSSFALLARGFVITQWFDLDGAQLWFSSYARQPALARIGLGPRSRPEPVALPEIGDDAVAFIAQNPVRRSEIAIATFKRSLFVSKDRGGAWTQIADEGTGLSVSAMAVPQR